jgi:hypothetical protein
MLTWAGGTRYWERIIRRTRQKNQYAETLDGPAVFMPGASARVFKQNEL